MKKKCFLLTIIAILYILTIINSSIAAPEVGKSYWIGESDDKINYDLEYLQKILKQDKKTFNISKNYINEIQTNTVKSFAQGVMDKKAKQINELELFIIEHRREFR